VTYFEKLTVDVALPEDGAEERRRAPKRFGALGKQREFVYGR